MENIKISSSLEVNDVLSRMKDYINKLESSITDMVGNSYTTLAKQEEDIRILKEENACYEAEIIKYKSTIENMEKDKSSFSKISHIISLENENHKLKQDIDLLNTRIKRLIEQNNNNPRNEQVEPLCDVVSQSHEGCFEDNFTEHSNNEITFIKKKINGTFYYIKQTNDIVQNSIQPFFVINDDDTVGSQVGSIIIKDDGKKKIQWL